VDAVGFYGGVNYGYGYTGSGYQGGRWDHGVFNYNRSVSNVNTRVVHNVYNATVINNTHVTRVSFNGGPNGVAARPTPAEMKTQAGPHAGATPAQLQHEHAALATPAMRASVNHGAPRIPASPEPMPAAAHARNEAAPAHEQPAARAPEPQAMRAPPPARETAAPERHAQARPEEGPRPQPQAQQARPQAPRPEEAPHQVRPPAPRPEEAPQQARPQSPRPEERAEPAAHAEPHRQEPESKER
jgi:hypothetical protein